MAVDTYSLCPGGEDKKVKFCCPDQMGDLEKIGRMLRGKQFAGCLEHLKRLEKVRPGRACLLAIKCFLLRMADKAEEADETAAEFLQKHPNNQLALAESALTAVATGDGPKALGLGLRAFAAAGGKIHPRTFYAWTATVEVLLLSGMYVAARALTLLCATVRSSDRQATEMLLKINSFDVPLVLKDERSLAVCPDDAPWKAAFDEALSLANQVCWLEAAERLAALASGEAADSPVVWRNLSILRGWSADTAGAIEALEKLATLDVPLEDAVEVQAAALFLKPDPLGDQFDIQDVTFAIHDAEAAQISLMSAAQVQLEPIDLTELTDEDGLPPRATFAIFEGPEPDGRRPLAIDTSPRLLCQAWLFGKQTDRQARLEIIDLADPEAVELKRLLGEILGDALGEIIEEETTGRLSRGQDLLARRRRLPKDVTAEQIEPFQVGLAEDALLRKWTEAPLGLLDGKSPREAAGSEDLRVKTLAAVMVVEEWIRRIGLTFDLNRLRRELGLPTLEPIELGDGEVDDVPLCRLSRLIVEKLSDDVLLAGFQRSAAFGATEPMLRFAAEVADRPGIDETVHRMQAYDCLARLSEEPSRAIEYADRGRRASVAAGQSCVHWDFAELLRRLQNQEPEEALRLIKHIQSQHINEPGVGEALSGLLIRMGLVRADGTPVAVPAGSGDVADLDAEPDSGGIWTPDGRKPGRKSELWTPDMG